MNIKQSILGLVAVTSVLGAPLAAEAGEAYVQNTDRYTTSQSRTFVNISGRDHYNGIRKEFSGAFKIQEFDRDTDRQAQPNILTTDIDDGISGSVSATYTRTRIGGYSKFKGFTDTYEQGSTYTHEVVGGTR